VRQQIPVVVEVRLQLRCEEALPCRQANLIDPVDVAGNRQSSAVEKIDADGATRRAVRDAILLTSLYRI
jgi:hypothetical protein